MQVKYARTELPKTIFLAGPTPRDEDVLSWRPDALKFLEKHQFKGTVYVPEDSEQSWSFNYDGQVEWELEALHSSTCIIFWIPRDAHMPGFTTNVEFGLFARNRNIVMGWPPKAVKMKYLESLSVLYGINNYRTLEETVLSAIALTDRPFPTTDHRKM